MLDTDQFHSLRRLLIFWICLVALWGTLNIRTGQVLSVAGTAIVLAPKNSTLPFIPGNLMQKAAFLLLLLCIGILLWAGLVGKIVRRFYWIYFPLQGALVLLGSLLIQQVNVAFNLYLALTLGAVVMLRHIRAVIAVASIYLLLLLLCTFLSFTPWYSWKLPWDIVNVNMLWLNFWSSSDAMTLILFVTGFLMLYTQQIQAHTQLERAHHRLQRSTERIEHLTRLTERQRLARELHDTLAQGLAGITMQLQVANSHLTAGREVRAQQIICQALGTSREILTGARRAIDNLRITLFTPEELLQAIQEEVQDFSNTTSIVCKMEDLTLLHLFPSFTYEHLLRMIKEGLSNIARHADATKVWITNERQGDMLLLQVCDNGRGFNPATIEIQKGHYGLLGLSERAELIGGRLEISSQPGAGTQLRFYLPLEEQGEGDE